MLEIMMLQRENDPALLLEEFKYTVFSKKMFAYYFHFHFQAFYVNVFRLTCVGLPTWL